jgi:hypothetical protein
MGELKPQQGMTKKKNTIGLRIEGVLSSLHQQIISTTPQINPDCSCSKKLTEEE